MSDRLLCPMLPAYVANQLSDGSSPAFQQHLLSCPHCRREAHRLLAARAVRVAREVAGAMREMAYDLACAAAVVGLVIGGDVVRWARGGRR